MRPLKTDHAALSRAVVSGPCLSAGPSSATSRKRCVASSQVSLLRSSGLICGTRKAKSREIEPWGVITEAW